MKGNEANDDKAEVNKREGEAKSTRRRQKKVPLRRLLCSQYILVSAQTKLAPTFSSCVVVIIVIVVVFLTRRHPAGSPPAPGSGRRFETPSQPWSPLCTSPCVLLVPRVRPARLVRFRRFRLSPCSYCGIFILWRHTIFLSTKIQTNCPTRFADPASTPRSAHLAARANEGGRRKEEDNNETMRRGGKIFLLSSSLGWPISLFCYSPSPLLRCAVPRPRPRPRPLPFPPLPPPLPSSPIPYRTAALDNDSY